MTEHLVISEIFGPTVQGEGPSLGRRAGFVRLGRCNLRCAFCDTPYTWDWDRFEPANELRHVDTDAVVRQLEGMGITFVVVTGGEPLIQQVALASLLRAAGDRNWRVEIETAGTIAPEFTLIGLVTGFNVSPKLANSGNPLDRRHKPDVLRAFEATGKATFKFVAAEPSDLDEIAAIVAECGLTDIWVMAEGTDPAAVTNRSRRLADQVIARGWNLTTRLHILLWGDERGR